MEVDVLSRRGVILAGLATAAGIGVSSWYRSFDYEGTADERIYAKTDDGWRLAVYKYCASSSSKKRPYPVVAGHGFAGSHLIYDLNGSGLARFLANAGYDFYAVDLRGRGESWPEGGRSRRLQWSFDDFALYDLPASLSAACTASNADQAFWLGMEMSGQALYAGCVLGTASAVRAGITFGAPVSTPPTALVPGVTSSPTQRIFGRVPFNAGARMAGPILAYTKSNALESSFRPSNSDPIAVARYFRNGVPDESSVIADQFKDWITNNVMRSVDHKIVYSDNLDKVDIALLMIVGARDLQRPPESVRSAFDALKTADKTFVEAGVQNGFSLDFGHDDLVAGLASPEEIYPKILAWLDDHS
ncbi:MAG: alpha/beta hydrolase [Actinobacteria bacterium]|nr:alpha/beta hydrolase [Actinomycetota bacterium]